MEALEYSSDTHVTVVAREQIQTLERLRTMPFAADTEGNVARGSVVAGVAAAAENQTYWASTCAHHEAVVGIAEESP